MSTIKITMTPKIKAAFILNVLVVLFGFAFGLRYIFSPGLLGYHLKAMGLSSWSEVVPAYKHMLITFLRVAGMGMTTLAFAMGVILFYPFRRGENWARWAFIGVFFVHNLPLLFNMIYLKTFTNTNPPFGSLVVSVVILLISFWLSSDLKNCRKENKKSKVAA